MSERALVDVPPTIRTTLVQPHPRPWPRVIAAVVVLAIAVRVAVGMALLGGGGPSFVLASDDGDAYDAAARWVALGEPIAFTPRLAGKWDPSTDLTARWPQGYWLFLAANYRLAGTGAYASAIVVQGVLGGLSVLAAFSIARRTLWGDRWALAAAALVAVSSTGMYLSAALYAEALFIPLTLAGLAAVLHARSAASAASDGASVWRWGVASGLAFALAEATRPVALAVLAVALVWILLPFGGWSTRQRLQAGGAVVVGFACGLVPFCAHDLVASGHVSVFTVGGGAALGDSQREAVVGLFERVVLLFVTGGWAPLGEPALAWLGPIGVAARAALFVLAAVGAVLVCRPGQREPAAGWLLVGAIVALVGTALAVALPLVRYRAAADPLFIVCLCAALEAATTARTIRR